jgi:hypothetical protein
MAGAPADDLEADDLHALVRVGQDEAGFTPI